MVWLFYDDHQPRLMTENEAALPEEATLLLRYAAFLNTDFSYEWPTSDFIRVSGLGALVPLSLGLLAPVDRWIKRRNARIDEEMDRHGDWVVWPFTRRDQWPGEPIPPYVR